MKNLLRITLFGFALVGFSANASLNIKSVELVDSTVIDGSEIYAINIFNSNAQVESVETSDGLLIHANEIKKIHISRPFGQSLIMGAKISGGEGSGG